MLKVTAKSKTATKSQSAKKPITKSKTVSAKTAKTKSALKKVVAKKTATKPKTFKVVKPKTKATVKKKVVKAKLTPKAAKPRLTKPKTKAIKPKVVRAKTSKITKPKSVKPKTAKKPTAKKAVSKTAKVVRAKKAIMKTAKAKVVRKTRTKTKKIAPAKTLTTKEQLKKLIAEAAAKKIALQKAEKKKKRIKRTVPQPKPKVEQVANNNRKKPVRAITSAIIRGKKTAYDFKVYEIGQNLGSVPAVFVISKRVTDRRKRGHHSFICIGETESILDALKKHRKSKCLRQNEANVISILREENEKKRLQIAEDLKTAHSIACNQQ